MTLRLRLVLALVALLVLGLGGFGFANERLFERSQLQRLDDQLRAAAPAIPHRLGGDGAGPGGGSGTGSPDGRSGDGPPEVVGVDTYAEVRTSTGRATGRSLTLTSSSSTPKLPATLTPDGRPGRFLTTGSTSGSGSWRVYVTRAAAPDEAAGATPSAGAAVVVVALPLSSVSGPVHRLLLIETVAGAALLVVIAAGALLILRRGLRPLERMAGSARDIAGGDLSLRVAPADARSEVGQLGLALNTMLDDIELAFREREATEARLRQFLADASHELRTPLTSIQGFAELFRLGADTEHVDLPVIMRRIEQESARMKALVEDLLLLARLDETRAQARERVDLAVLAADACSDAAATDPTRAITLVAPEPVPIDVIADHVRQALANLVTNALRHTPAGTPIEVGAERDGELVALWVRDHGPGLDAEAAAHAFDRFWQGDRSRTGAGAGLGLAIVVAIAAEHGGTATAENPPDGGARFTLRLPRTDAA